MTLETCGSHPLKGKPRHRLVLIPSHARKLPLHFFFINCWIFPPPRNPICRGTAELWEQGRWELAQAQGAPFTASFLVLLRRSHAKGHLGLRVSCSVFSPLGPYLILLSGGSVQKDNKENTSRRLQDCHVAVTIAV